MLSDNTHSTSLNDEIGGKQTEEGRKSFSPQSSTPAELVDAINLVFGKQTYNRAIHAKGIVLEGRFHPSSLAATLSKAPHFQNVAVPVTIRFSDFAGIPQYQTQMLLQIPEVWH